MHEEQRLVVLDFARGGARDLKSVTSQITLFPSFRILYTKRPHTSLGKQTLNISVRIRSLLHKTLGTEKKDNHTRVLALAPALRPCTYCAHSAARLGSAMFSESYFSKCEAGKKITARRTNEVRVGAFPLFRAYGA